MEVGNECLEIFFDGFPFEVVARAVAEEHGAAFVVFVETAFDVWDDFGWQWIWVWNVDAHAIAARFEVRNLALGIEGGQLGQRCWRCDFGDVVCVHNRTFPFLPIGDAGPRRRIEVADSR